MLKTAKMRLLELMVLRSDISAVIEFLGKSSNFQLRNDLKDKQNKEQNHTLEDISLRLGTMEKNRMFFGIPDLEECELDSPIIDENGKTECDKISSQAEHFRSILDDATEKERRIHDLYKEALAFSNLEMGYEDIERLSFLSMRIGKIPPQNVEALKEKLGNNAVIAPLGEEGGLYFIASSKKWRFMIDTETKKSGFVPVSLSKEFKGISKELIDKLKNELSEASKKVNEIKKEIESYAVTHKERIIELIKELSIGVQVETIKSSLESTSMVYHITGWVPEEESSFLIRKLDSLTSGRVAIKEYLPHEVRSVLSGNEKVPVKLKHGTFVQSFERMIFSYGSPIYNSIDPTPFVAVFFTLLFGIMFGDAGQALVFLIIGILMKKKIIKVGSWNKVAPIFIAIGITSMIMGVLAGEFFATSDLLKPISYFITHFFGEPHHPILPLMPSSDPRSIKVMFNVFALAVAIGFVINSAGIVLNLVNKFSFRNWGEFLFGKTALSGAIFFWYTVFFALKVTLFKAQSYPIDWIIIGFSLFFSSFAEPFARLVNGKKPAMENSVGATFISGIVELIEVVSGYLSNTVSFLRVGAFALAHAVLGYIIHTMTHLCGGIMGPGFLVLLVGNAVVIVLEGMIVAIQVIRLQYYEFFSKFFSETGTEFVPLKFKYKNKI